MAKLWELRDMKKSDSVVELSGTVILTRVNRGSKSERESPMLKAGNKLFHLRRSGEVVFGDAFFLPFIGSSVRVKGKLLDNILFAEEIHLCGSERNPERKK